MTIVVILSLTMVPTFFLALSSTVKAVSNYEVTFRGTIAADERSDSWLFHGNSYSIVTVDAIFNDSSAILSVGKNVTIVYGYSQDLKVGEYVDCFGVKDEIDRAESAATSWYIRCWPEPYYVRRTPFFNMLSMILTLSYVAIPLLALYFYRKKQHKAGFEREIQKS